MSVCECTSIGFAFVSVFFAYSLKLLGNYHAFDRFPVKGYLMVF